ncbi:MAG: ABC transporter permease [Deltaproteobacteria bacterium]|nr:MAG: ABC transporter permease [Deltaproteobacteria bacterium]
MGPVQALGEISLYYINFAGKMTLLLGQCIWAAVTPPYDWRAILRQINFIGARSMGVIILTGLFTGMILSLQGYHLLSQYGSVSALGAGVGNGLIRELGPVLTALMVIGRAGSAICAEIGIMRNSEQIDALSCMAIDPVRYLLAPKFTACVFSMLLLSFIFDVVGIFGGYIVGVALSDVSSGSYFQGMADAIYFSDVKMGLYKAAVFGVVTVWIATSKGYFVHLERLGGFGAEGVSRATTNAVVLSSISILLWDYLISALMI